MAIRVIRKREQGELETVQAQVQESVPDRVRDIERMDRSDKTCTGCESESG